MPTKRVKIFACVATFSPLKFAEIFKIDNLSLNCKRLELESGNTPHLLVVDKEEDGFLFGRFIRLRKEAPPILDIEHKTEEDFELTITRYLEEISHFIWNVTEGLLLCQYNHYGIRHFPTCLNPYFNALWENKFRDKVILPIDNPDTFKEFEHDKSGILSFRVRIAKKDVVRDEKERYHGFSGLLKNPFGFGTFFNLGDDESYYEIVVRKGRRKTSEVKQGEVLKAVEHLKSGREEVQITAETRDACYDLIEGNVFNYKTTVETKEEEYENKKKVIVDKEAFFKEAQRLYYTHAEHVLSTVDLGDMLPTERAHIRRTYVEETNV